ncbi:sensor histidine kinase [Pedobacter miscanthi]|uniref:sensor histidine kinase n=1 Tax=Pedobacter miscanthi TaxID=2259170 RepID=UPI00292F6DAC|nr:histidine kinase [Pedobacter miscanthi]
MLKEYQLKWFFILAGSLTLSALLLRKEPFTGITYWQVLYFILSVHVGVGVCWMSLGYFITGNFGFRYKVVKHFLAIIISIMVSFLLAYLMHLLLPANPLEGKSVGFDTLDNILVNFSGMVVVSLICYVVFYSAHTTSALQNTRFENERLEQAHLRAQLISLQQQISPHFLFNSLSTLRTMVADQPTRNYIVQLSNVYRYVLRFNEHYLTALSEELNFINSYLYILNERFEDALYVKVNVAPECLHLQLPPMSLQLLVENAIKHNMASPDKPLQIAIFNGDGHSLTVENNLQKKMSGVERGGTGLKNIIERYKLLAGKDIKISQNSEKFAVIIPLLEK